MLMVGSGRVNERQDPLPPPSPSSSFSQQACPNVPHPVPLPSLGALHRKSSKGLHGDGEGEGSEDGDGEESCLSSLPLAADASVRQIAAKQSRWAARILTRGSPQSGATPTAQEA